MGRACSTYGARRGVYRVLVGKPEGKRSLGRLRHRWEDNIKAGSQLVKKFPAFYGRQRFITAFTNVRHLYLS